MAAEEDRKLLQAIHGLCKNGFQASREERTIIISGIDICNTTVKVMMANQNQLIADIDRIGVEVKALTETTMKLVGLRKYQASLAAMTAGVAASVTTILFALAWAFRAHL